jgi:hypothetical protein
MDPMIDRVDVEPGPEGRCEFVARRNASRINAKVLNELTALLRSRAAVPHRSAPHCERAQKPEVQCDIRRRFNVDVRCKQEQSLTTKEFEVGFTTKMFAIVFGWGQSERFGLARWRTSQKRRRSNVRCDDGGLLLIIACIALQDTVNPVERDHVIE